MSKATSTQDMTVSVPVVTYTCDQDGTTAEVPQYRGMDRREHRNDANPIADWILNSVDGKDFCKKDCLKAFLNV